MAVVVAGFLSTFRQWLKPGQTSQAESEARTATSTKQANNLGSGAIAQSGGNAASNHAVVVGGNVNGNITIEHHKSVADQSHSLRACYLRRVLADCGELKLDAVDREAAGQGGKASLSLKAVYTALLTRTPRRVDTDHLTARSQAEYNSAAS